ncbi:uncharacterized protein GVI51_M10373 [Nakaseomyces glabratus]|uniref:RecA family profile 1 domain-containing protein n=1 Tax=Candida glabrata (strain ATCC 2001 / BCRC 20586 / JCM 3761 / NBRC 0622 / NRRL Y-65 / CBS 138) TaxID=284593 RepID=Q6FIZ6_CANGA|nr:uncharacterized protein CAGL0M10373g [Nakaseomyces glabratus]KAH7579738.1 RecA family profile 1 [Nakaseomyces glabratus]KAH7592919.1 RecA family profile 1 [Nakaseomyces glabratus]KAH7593990.1 RecA family profile 1 [Nakaseomyces glabratus]KAH7600440.1 RecA family profile 1 [Nakaseomyces glabratus]KAH7610763.1 RecA family profile 1 [Nakaseomyces glabratus]|eukprot:XP_449798.1 uncharacterized protein CAGL0M10373g [[Candida] glabrata]
MDLYEELPGSQLLFDPEFETFLEALNANKVTCVDFLTLKAPDLAKLSQRSINEVIRFQQRLIREYDAQYNSNSTKPLAKQIPNKQFTTGDLGIDEVLGGGISTNCITEIFGESSTGKSQLLMQLCLSVQLPISEGGLNAKCVFITTEGDLPTNRLAGMIEARKDWHELGISQSNIFTVSCPDLISQEHIVNVQLPVLLERNKGEIKLIIIDSISHHLRVELDTKSFKDSLENKAYITEMAEKLQGIATKHSVAIVVANQVGDKPLNENLDPYNLNVNDLEYQLGWLVGWKNSTILYRQTIQQIGFQKQQVIASNADSILSDDEDYMLVEEQVRRIKREEDGEKFVESGIGGSTSALARGEVEEADNKLTELKPRKNNSVKKTIKRKMDHRVPNLGLTWANYVSTRILLKKSYAASPMIRRGELKKYKGSDTSDFWQVKRLLKVVYSSFCTPEEINFKITKCGVESV